MHVPDDDLEAVRRMTPARKLEVLRSLIRQAHRLKEADLRARRPDLPDAEVRALARALVAGERT